MVSFLIWGTLLLGADEPAAKAELAGQVARLVRQLDAAELSQRDEAERKLLELGPDALPLLPAIGPRTPAGVSLRVTRVQQKLLRAQAATAMEPSLVTLKGDDLQLSDVLKQIAGQTGNTITDHRQEFGEQQDDAHVKADFEKTPFWRTLDNVLDQANLTLYGFAGQRGAAVIARPGGMSPRAAKAVYAGVFRLEAARFEAVRDLRNETMQSLKLFLEVTWEPRLQPFAILQPLSQVTAVDDTGHPIAVAGADGEPEAMIREGLSTVELEIPFALPDRKAQKISQLKGKLLALVPGPLHDFRFADLKVSKTAAVERAEQRQAGTTVSVDRVRKNNAAWEVSLRVKFEAPSMALESHRGWVLENEAFFEDAKGQRFEPGGIEQTQESKDEIGINYYFDLRESPEKLSFVYRTPITILEMPVQYEFRDLRLP